MEPQAQFRWAYAAYEAARKTNFVNQHKTLRDIEQALQRAASVSPPRNYEYARLRFLAIARNSPYHNLKPVGERLVRRNPQDHEVRFYLVELLDPGLHSEEKQSALMHARFLAQALPEKPTVHSLLGSVYWRIWLKSKSPADADKAIAGYRKFLQTAPPNHPFRRGAESQIKFIRHMQERQANRRQ